MVDMAHAIDSQSNLPTTFIDGGCQKNPSETSDRADFELRKKRFQEQYADWFFYRKSTLKNTVSGGKAVFRG